MVGLGEGPEPGSVAVQPEKSVARYRSVGENVLAGNDCWCPCYICPTVGCVDVSRRLKGKITVVRGPGEDGGSSELLNGQGWVPEFKGADVAGVAASGVGDGGEVDWPWRAALVGGWTPIFALVDGGAARAQSTSARWSAIIRQRCQQRVHTSERMRSAADEGHPGG